MFSLPSIITGKHTKLNHLIEVFFYNFLDQDPIYPRHRLRQQVLE